ncbi:MAG: hypothetical protein WAL66_17250 [Nitrososphaeraceae archaeon]
MILKAGPGAVTPRLAQTGCGNVMLLKAGPGAVTPRLAQTGCGKGPDSFRSVPTT